MDVTQLQAQIDAIKWYHEFDFGNGLKARNKKSEAKGLRPIWKFIERNLDTVDFTDKSVLEIGCWDGYWSFYAERRGARSVLATDDHTQNSGARSGLLLAKELLGSGVEVNDQVSVYKLETLNRKFDIILFLGVYYHLFAPFYALAQIRHCCHDATVVLMEGFEAATLTPGTALYNFPDHGCEWMPTRSALEQLLGASYFNVVSVDCYPAEAEPAGLPGRRWRLRLIEKVIRDSRAGVHGMTRQLEPGVRRTFMKCVPFEGESEFHIYPPPFELHRYDNRFWDK